MHISNDCYFDDRERHDLALRMIAHEARTCTIRTCTGLSDDRIRVLYKAYRRQRPAVRRRRGKSPRCIAFFTRTARTQFEASFLAGLFLSFDLLEAGTSQLRAGQLFCDAYETHLQLCERATISFEHAWFLLELLRRRVELSIDHCRYCECMYVRDPQNIARLDCPACELREAESDESRRTPPHAVAE